MLSMSSLFIISATVIVGEYFTRFTNSISPRFLVKETVRRVFEPWADITWLSLDLELDESREHCLAEIIKIQLNILVV